MNNDEELETLETLDVTPSNNPAPNDTQAVSSTTNEQVTTLDPPRTNLEPSVTNNQTIAPETPVNSVPTGENTIVEYKEVLGEKNPFIANIKNNYIKYLIITGIVLVIAGASVFYALVISSPKNILSKSFDKIIDKINYSTNYIDPINNLNIGSNSFKTSGNFKFSTNIEEYRELSKYSLDYELSADFNNNILYTNDTLYLEDETLLGIIGLIKSDNSFIQLKEVYDKYLELPYGLGSEESSMVPTEVTSNAYSSEKLIELLQIIKEYFFDGIDKKCLSKNNKQMSINGERINVNEFAYKADKKALQKNVSYVLEKILKDDKALNIMVDLTSQPKADIINWLETNELNDITTESISILVYTTGLKREFVGIAVKDEEYREKFHYYVNNNKTNIFIEDEKDKIEINKFQSGSLEKIEVRLNEELMVSVDAETLSPNEIKAKISLIKQEMDFQVEYKYTEENNKKIIYLKLQINNGNAYMRFVFNNTTESNVNVNANIDTSNSVKELNPQDIEAVIKKLHEKLDGTLLNRLPIFLEAYIAINQPIDPIIDEPEIPNVELEEVDVDLSTSTKNSFKQEVKDLLKATEDAYIANKANNRNVTCYYKIATIDPSTGLEKMEYSKVEDQINIPNINNKKGFTYAVTINFDQIKGVSTFNFKVSNGKYYSYGSNNYYYDDFVIYETDGRITNACK